MFKEQRPQHAGTSNSTDDASSGAQPGKQTLAGVHESAARGIATPSSPLPYAEQIQQSFGRHDVSGVQAHQGGEAAASARDMSAQAYATGNHVVFAGAPDLHTAAHEAAHVVQQRAGVHLKGGVGAQNDAYEQHADSVADLVVAGRSAEPLLDSFSSGGSFEPNIQRKFLPSYGDTFIDMETRDSYRLVRRAPSFLLLERDRDHFQIRVDLETMEPIENEFQRKFRLGKAEDPQEPNQAPQQLDAPYEPPSLAQLYQRMFPNGTTFQQRSPQEIWEEAQTQRLIVLAKEVDQLKARARAGDLFAREELSEKGPLMQQLGNELTQHFFGRVENYRDFLHLMDQFLAGKLPTNPVYTGLLWSESNDLVGQLRQLTQFGITTWESQPSNEERPLENAPEITERQFGFLELSGPADLIRGLVLQLRSFNNLTIIYPGDTQRVPLKQFRSRSQDLLQQLATTSQRFLDVKRQGGGYRVDWLDQITNNSKYVGRALQSVPSLEGVIGDHTYLHLVSKDPDNALSLFDTVSAILPRVQPVQGNLHTDDDDGQEHRAEAEHQDSYSSTAFTGNLNS